SLGDELPKLHCEANTLYWAKALLMMTYDFIDGAIASANSPPPFEIPCLHFIEAGLALAHSQLMKGPTKPKLSGTICSYIHNMDCRPSMSVDMHGYDIAEFLAFTQHIQYSKTGGLVFISDYQGKLCECSYTSGSSVSDGLDVFSEGNVESTITSFEKCHECNQFCKWLGFSLNGFRDKAASSHESLPTP
ncbi:hypothetical protein EDC04DRAFT_2571972, partial [Pisolithus marmoratus]